MPRTGSSAAGSRKLAPRSEFLTVDLDVRSRRSLAPLVEAWPWAQTPGCEPGRVPRWLVLSPRVDAVSAENAVRHLVKLVDALPRAARVCWKKASSRTFDVGIRSGLEPAAFEDVRLREATLRALARIDARLLVTVYSPCEA